MTINFPLMGIRNSVAHSFLTLFAALGFCCFLVSPFFVSIVLGQEIDSGSPKLNQVQNAEYSSKKRTPDYLIDPAPFVAKAAKSDDGMQLVVENGLIRRVWNLQPNGACVDFDNLVNSQSMLRSVRPEARVTIDDKEFKVGGLIGQPNHAYLTPKWLKQMKSDPAAMQLIDVTIAKPLERLKWKRRRHTAPNLKWPPSGVYVRMDYGLPKNVDNSAPEPKFTVSVHYEMYDGLPVMSKWITVDNSSNKTITVTRFRGEELATIEHANWVELRGKVEFPKPEYLHVETDFAFGGFNFQNSNRHTVSWREDPEYKTQVNYLKKSKCLLVVEPTYGPDQDIKPGERFESFRVFELAFGTSDRERRGLALRRMYRTLAPWVTENPITHHLLSSQPKEVLRAIDQAAEVGFEAIIMSFGSGFQMENTDPKYLKQWTEVAKVAEQKGVELGSYSLFSSRSVGGGNDVVSPEGQKPAFGLAPAATSKWGVEYFERLKRFYDQTGFDQFENDGPYPGDLDVTERLPLQKGVNDSRWAQWKVVCGLYHHLRATGVYINQPDYYFMNGGNKTGMGYRETNWSLPRAQQLIHTRQNIFDGTWTKTPSMGWMHVPLAEYHGGGPAATIEPLHQHLDHYQRMMESNFGMGVQAHYRGPRLFDTEETKQRVSQTVAWFKKYREILESDIVHGRRADGRDLDWVLHVNPQLKERGLLCVWNPIDQSVTKKLQVNLYYTGADSQVTISERGSDPVVKSLNRDFGIELEVTVGAGEMNWFVIE